MIIHSVTDDFHKNISGLKVFFSKETDPHNDQTPKEDSHEQED